MKVVVNLERRIDPAAAKRLLELIFGDAIRREATLAQQQAVEVSRGESGPDRAESWPTAPTR
ncbi:MAG: hypothetical protein GY722_15160 [bacterium]|nr:hypothetical protein [bacterium]